MSLPAGVISFTIGVIPHIKHTENSESLITYSNSRLAREPNIIPAQNYSIKPNLKPKFFLQRNKPCRSLAKSQKRVSELFFVAPQIIFYHTV
jgi:hypothetical protein